MHPGIWDSKPNRFESVGYTIHTYVVFTRKDLGVSLCIEHVSACACEYVRDLGSAGEHTIYKGLTPTRRANLRFSASLLAYPQFKDNHAPHYIVPWPRGRRFGRTTTRKWVSSNWFPSGLFGLPSSLPLAMGWSNEFRASRTDAIRCIVATAFFCPTAETY